MVEMLEATMLLCFASEKSLILFDEIGRGTATLMECYCPGNTLNILPVNYARRYYFSTHYHELTFLEDKGLGIQNVHASARVDNDHLAFEYLITKRTS